MMNDDKLNEILLKRDIPMPSSNLAYRISHMAQERGAIRPISFFDEMLRLFVIPKPAYVTAFCLVFGLVIGIYTGVEDATGQEWFSFLEVQEEDWL